MEKSSFRPCASRCVPLPLNDDLLFTSSLTVAHETVCHSGSWIERASIAAKNSPRRKSVMFNVDGQRRKVHLLSEPTAATCTVVTDRRGSNPQNGCLECAAYVSSEGPNSQADH